MTFESQAFVHEASLALEHGADPRAPGGAVSDRIRRGCAESSQIHALIDTALRGGDGWRVLSSGPRAVAPDEQDLAASLLRAPRA